MNLLSSIPVLITFMGMENMIEQLIIRLVDKVTLR